MKNKIFSFFKEGNDRTIKAKYNILYSLLLMWWNTSFINYYSINT